MSWSSFGEQEQPNKDPAFLRFAGSRGDHQGWGRAGMDEVEQEQPPHLRASRVFLFFLSCQLHESHPKNSQGHPFCC